MMTEQRYLELLDPYLIVAFEPIDWPTAYTARLLIAVKLHKQAAGELYRDLGIADPRTKLPDMTKVMDRYIDGKAS